MSWPFFCMMIRFILASQSPRRRELLQLLGYPFQSLSADADEDSIDVAEPALNVQQTAVLKADTITNQYQPKSQIREILIAADTTVAFDGQMLNKPKDEADATAMLTAMCNKTHEVFTGYIIRDLTSRQELVGVSTAVVTMRNYSQKEIANYIATGDPMDKAGAYAIQHPQFNPVAELNGCYLNVMGLPVCDLILALRHFGLDPDYVRSDLSLAHQRYPCPTLIHQL